MPEFKVTVTSGYKKIYYVQAEDWETAQDMVEEPYAYGLVENVGADLKPDQEEYLREEIEAEEAEDDQ